MNFSGLTAKEIKRKENGDADHAAKSIALHKKAIRHLEEAARFHHEAIKYRQQQDPEKAKRSALKAYDHIALAMEAQKQDFRLNAW